jgi:hypothetical protein
MTRPQSIKSPIEGASWWRKRVADIRLRDRNAVTEQHEVNRLRLLVDERIIVGALVMGDQTLSRPLQNLIANQVDIVPIRQAIQDDPGAILSLILNLHRQWAAKHS